MKGVLKNVIIFFIALILIGLLFSSMNASFEEKEKIDVSQLISQIEDEEVKEINVEGPNKMIVTLHDDTKQELRKESTESLSELLKNYEVSTDKIKMIQINVKEEGGASFWLKSLLPIMIPILIIGAFIFYMMRQVQSANSRAMTFGQSRSREQDKEKGKKTNFKDVAGVKEAKEELKEIVDFLQNPRKFTALGAKIPKGVLLVGPPGTGKTLLAKAVAGEADVPFFSISGSEFVEMFVGVGASRVRDLFSKAQKKAPCIIFIDELDAVGRQRGAGLGGSHDEREQTLNQILVEMDGFDPNAGVIILAATNRPDVLDPALLRPGRFDRRVILDEPDIDDREAILKIHAKQKPISQEVSLRSVAERTPGFSGADLANLLNEAAITTARRNKKIIGTSEIIDSIEKVMLGPERKSHILSDKEKKITSYHEAAHALVAHELPNTDPVHKISIISRGRAAGYTLKMPTEDKHLHARQEFIEELAVLLAGFVCEKEIFNDVTTGASNDLRRATQVAHRLIKEFGMSEKLGPRTFGEKEELIFLGREIHEQKNYSEKIAEMIDTEVSSLIDNATKTAKKIITSKKALLEKIVAELLEKETIEREQFEIIVGKKKQI